MGLRKTVGILVFSVQAVIGADYYFQTRDAGLSWGELSAAEYSQIVQARFDRSQTGLGREERAPLLLSNVAPGVSGHGHGLVQQAEETEPAICVRRGTTLDCQ